MFGLMIICFFIAFVYFLYILSPALFWVIICLSGFIWSVFASGDSNNPNVGSHWSDGS